MTNNIESIMDTILNPLSPYEELEHAIDLLNKLYHEMIDQNDISILSQTQKQRQALLLTL